MIKKLFCWVFGHEYYYWVHDGEVGGVDYWDKLYYDKCQRCHKPTPEDEYEKD